MCGFCEAVVFCGFDGDLGYGFLVVGVFFSGGAVAEVVVSCEDGFDEVIPLLLVY